LSGASLAGASITRLLQSPPAQMYPALLRSQLFSKLWYRNFTFEE